MNYVKNLNICGVDIKEIPCITGSGAPTTATEGAVGLLYMDIASENKDVYKCTAKTDNTYTWEPFGSGSGGNGQDGVSPIIEVTETSSGHRVTITDVEGEKSFDVDDGYSPEITVSQLANGATISVTDESGVTRNVTIYNGKDGTSPHVEEIADMDGRTGVSIGGVEIWSGLDGKEGATGPKGNDGYTPVKGVDYWTKTEQTAIQADNKAFIVEEVAKRNQVKPEFANSIDECTDTTKLYVLPPDNHFYAYMTVTETHEPTNQIKYAEETDETLYNGGVGYKDNTRLSLSSGESTQNNYTVTGFMKGTIGDTLRFANINTSSTSTNTFIIFYDSNHTWVGHLRNQYATDVFSVGECVVSDDMEGLSLNSSAGFTTLASAVYFRLSMITGNGEYVVTVNEPLDPYTATTTGWVDTGHAFVPADYEDRIFDLEGRATSLELRFDNLSAGDGGSFTYVSNEASRVATIVKGHQTVGSLTFTAMSDMHIRFNDSAWKDNLTSCRDAGLGLTELRKLLKLDCIVMLGDYTVGGSTDAVGVVKEDLTGVREYMTNGMIGIPNIWCTGNHDINYGKNADRRMTEDELFAYLTNNNAGTTQDSENIGRNYGYIDFENQKIRCIYLNTVDSLDYADASGSNDDNSEITAIQTQWLVDEGLDFTEKENPSEWGIVVFSHHCLSIFPQVVNVLKGYKDGDSGSYNITTNGVTTTVSYDFTNLAERAEVICSVHGHNHNFMNKKISDEVVYAQTDENTWLWSIGVPNMDTYRNNACASYDDPDYARVFGEYDTDGNAVYYNKTQGTATSTSFSVITIDRKNRKVYATAYGAGYDREIEY